MRITGLVRKFHQGLSANITGATQSAPRRKIVIGSLFYKRAIAPLITAWVAEQLPKLSARINTSAEQSHKAIELAAYQVDTPWSAVATVGAGAGLVIAPIAAIPFVAGLATVTTTSFFVVTTATVSLPILGGIVAVGGVAGLTGRSVLKKQEQNHRDRLESRFQDIADQAVLGRNPDAVLARLLKQIDDIAKQRLESL